MSALAKGTVPFLKLALIIEGATEKLSQLEMKLKSIYSKNLSLKEQEGIFRML
jgi:hypothetical protein